MTEPVLTMKPLRILVVNRLLSIQEISGQVDFGADVLLSTKVANDPAPTDGNRFNGAAVYPARGGFLDQLNKSGRIESSFVSNAGLDHGPKAVAAAARTAATVLDDGPIRSPIFWLTGTTIGFGLTVLALSVSMSRRVRRERMYRRLSAAQHDLAGVVLDLEALEVTFRTTPEKQRTPGFTHTWLAIRDDSLSLAKTEDAVVEAVYRAGTSLKSATGEMVREFEERARALVEKSDALLGAGSVLARLDGGQRVLDRLAAPMKLAARELLARLAGATPTSISGNTIRKFDRALNNMLEVLGRDGGSDTQIAAWKTAEFKLERSAAAVTRSLKRNTRQTNSVVARTWENQRSLR